ncbi:MAG: class I SAM-dependent methyltransferase [Chloroflexi bacterium]|nr:class I SAM-dependent methyltransferase [Chloroflexota bacterium]
MLKDHRHRWFAAVWERTGNRYQSIRKEVVSGAKGRVLEVGAGTGFNLRYYSPRAISVTATEPNPFMLDRAKRRAGNAAHFIEFRQAPAEDLPFDDASFDTVVGTWVLCSVQDPGEALAELSRVLKPGGDFRFVEHVRHEPGFGGFWQSATAPVWRWVGAGCHLDRDTERSIRDAGFTVKELHRFNAAPPIPPLVFIKGVAAPPTQLNQDSVIWHPPELGGDTA